MRLFGGIGIRPVSYTHLDVYKRQGLRVAKIADAFGCEVYAYSRTKKEVPNVTYLGLSDLLKTCDVISLHVPFNEHTRCMIGKKELLSLIHI